MDSPFNSYWVYAEDLASALIGPFSNPADAVDHVEFCKKRGDGAPGRVMGLEEARQKLGTVSMITSPAQDRTVQVTVVSATLLRRRSGTDQVTLQTSLPGATYPFTHPLYITFSVARDQGLAYTQRHFAGVPLTTVDEVGV